MNKNGEVLSEVGVSGATSGFVLLTIFPTSGISPGTTRSATRAPRALSRMRSITGGTKADGHSTPCTTWRRR